MYRSEILIGRYPMNLSIVFYRTGWKLIFEILLKIVFYEILVSKNTISAIIWATALPRASNLWDDFSGKKDKFVFFEGLMHYFKIAVLHKRSSSLFLQHSVCCPPVLSIHRVYTKYISNVIFFQSLISWYLE